MVCIRTQALSSRVTTTVITSKLNVGRGSTPTVLLTMLLAMVSSSAIADWLQVAHDDQATQYINSTAFHKVADIVEFWQLTDFKEIQNANGLKPYSYSSFKTQNEMDCKKVKRRVIYATFHSKNMGGGEVTYVYSGPTNISFGLGQWAPIPPDTLYRNLFEEFCRSKE